MSAQDDDRTRYATRTTHLMANLEGALEDAMLHSLQGVWSVLEHAATDRPAHARAVRARLFWESLAPSDVVAPPVVLAVATQGFEDDAPAEDHEFGSHAEAA